MNAHEQTRHEELVDQLLRLKTEQAVLCREIAALQGEGELLREVHQISYRAYRRISKHGKMPVVMEVLVKTDAQPSGYYLAYPAKGRVRPLRASIGPSRFRPKPRIANEIMSAAPSGETHVDVRIAAIGWWGELPR